MRIKYKNNSAMNFWQCKNYYFLISYSKHSLMTKTATKKKSEKREPSPLARVLASSDRSEIVLNRYFSKLNPGAIKNSVQGLANHRHFSKAIKLSTNNATNFYKRLTPPSTIEKNISWCLGIVDYHHDRVQYFLDSEREITKSLFENDISGAIKHLDAIDKCCGLSTWSISLRGSLLTMAGMIEVKRTFLTGIYEDAGDNSYFKSIVHKIAEKYDYSDTLSAESKFFEQKIRRTFSGETLHFLMYKLIQNNFDFEYDFGHILEVEKNSSPIDIFQCLVDFICYAKLVDNEDVYKNEAIKATKSLSAQFVSPSLQGLANSYGIKTAWEFNALEYGILDKYTEGNYKEVCDIFHRMPELCIKFSLFEIWAKSACRVLPSEIEPGLLADLLDASRSMMLKDECFEKSVTFLLAQCHSFSMLPWFRELHYMIARETRFISKKKNSGLAKLSTAISEVASPQKAQCLPEILKEEYIADMSSHVRESVVFALYRSMYKYDDSDLNLLARNVAPLRQRKFLARKLIDQGEHEAAIYELELLRDSADIVIAHDAARMLVDVFIASNRIEDAISTYIQTVIHNPHLMRTFDSDSICAACEAIARSSRLLSVPIALSLHSRFINDKYDAALKYSFERFLINNHKNSPLELDEIRSEFDRDQLDYYLKNICIPDVMKLYLFFDGAKQIEECRIQICKQLIDQGKWIDEMVYEVKERTRKLVVLDATKHVENSRIYSDTAAFLHTASNDYRQLFERFTKIRGNDYSEEEDEKTLVKFYEIFKGDSLIAKNASIIHIQDLVLNEKNSTFLKLIKLMRDEFTFGEKGLNGHLSTRIRHGHFPNTLRKCVVDESLITAKLSTSGIHVRNSVWIERLMFSPSTSSQSFDKAFSEFSSKYEELIDEVNDQWLHIYTLDQDISGLADSKLPKNTLFNYSVTALEAYYIQSLVPLNAEYGDLVKIVTEWLWNRTEDNLSSIRKRIGAEARDRACRLLDELQSAIFSIVGDQDKISEFSDSIARARVSLSAAVDMIIGWFTRSQGLAITSFESDIAIEISRLSAGTTVTHVDSSNLIFQGRTLSYIVDILYVLLENSVTKSGLPKEELQIQTSLIECENAIIISVTNNTRVISDVDLANKQLSYYREAYGKGAVAIKAAQGEGGTGFFKVWKTLAKDLELQHEIKFGYESHDLFKVEITIDQSQITKIRHHENSNH